MSRYGNLSDEDMKEAKRALRMHYDLTHQAWLALSMREQVFSEQEQELIHINIEQSALLLDNYETFFENMIRDQAGMALIQAGMGPHMDYLNNLDA